MLWGCAFNDKAEGILNFENLFRNTEFEPCRKAFNRDSFIKIYNWRIYLSDKGRHGGFANARKKCLVVSISVPQVHMRLTQSLNLWQNLWLNLWLNFSCSLLSNYTPIWSYIENSDLCFDLKNCINIDMNCLIDLAPRMEFPKLFDSLTQTGKKIFKAFSSVRKFL